MLCFHWLIKLLRNKHLTDFRISSFSVLQLTTILLVVRLSIRTIFFWQIQFNVYSNLEICYFSVSNVLCFSFSNHLLYSCKQHSLSTLSFLDSALTMLPTGRCCLQFGTLRYALSCC